VFNWTRTIASINLGKWVWSTVWFYKNNHCSREKQSSLKHALRSYYLIATSIDSIYILDFEVKNLENDDFEVELVLRWMSDSFNWQSHYRIYHNFYVPELNTIIFSKQHSKLIIVLKIEMIGSNIYPVVQMISTDIQAIVGLAGFYQNHTESIVVFCAGTDGKIAKILLKEEDFTKRFVSKSVMEAEVHQPHASQIYLA